MSILTNTTSGPIPIMRSNTDSVYTNIVATQPSIVIHKNGTISIGDYTLTQEKLRLLDRLLLQEFPEEFI